MFLPNTYHVKDIRLLLMQEWLRVASDPTNEVAGTVELIGTSFIADDDTIFGEVDFSYITREILWYESQSLNVNDIPGGPPKIWRDVADNEGFINSNYGWLMFSHENGHQFERVLEHLQREPEGRRAVAIYTRPEMHWQWNADGRRDFICTNVVNYYLRDGYLHAIVQMRSNDAIFGYRNDYQWQSYILDQLSGRLKVRPGTIVWQAGSLHVYARHYHLLERFRSTDEYRVPVSKLKAVES
jgi:thymidylate synthase